ncbi:MAG TPA: methyltransferase domain-containing protein [Solirubrobacteraceae bacterium]|nr:methyltransferase domain-containing protein [Solirubrobacteraceae bacterium]
MTSGTAALTTTQFSISIEVGLEPEAAFARAVDELTLALGGDDDTGTALALVPGPEGRIVEDRRDGTHEVARVLAWEPPERILLSWMSADWGQGVRSEVELRFGASEVGTLIVFEHRGFGAPMLSSGDAQDSGRELLGWFVDQLLAPAARATAPLPLGRWLTDRRARRPTGPRARVSYRDPKEHGPGFDATLSALDLQVEDRLLEVGCGGGAFIRRALESGCRAVAVDHSEEMVRLTAEANADAVQAGRLVVTRADAARLPFADHSFTCAAMTHVFFFLEDPLAALSECKRVLGTGGRLVVYTSSACLAGTPAAPEPIVRYMHFYGDEEFRDLALGAGFARAEVADLGGAQLLTALA